MENKTIQNITISNPMNKVLVNKPVSVVNMSKLNEIMFWRYHKLKQNKQFKIMINTSLYPYISTYTITGILYIYILSTLQITYP